MNHKAEFILASALAAAACGGCRTYPARSSRYYSTTSYAPTAQTTYVTPAAYAPTYTAPAAAGTTTTYVTEPIGTSTIYVESYSSDPYYFGGSYYGPRYYGGIYYDRAPRRHHDHDPKHGHRHGLSMPPRGAGPALKPGPAHGAAPAHKPRPPHGATPAHKPEPPHSAAPAHRPGQHGAPAPRTAARNAAAARSMRRR